MSALGIPQKMERLHQRLEDAGLAHAFGGALALAWCTREVRATMDIDLNVFVDVSHVDRVLAALGEDVTWSPQDEVALRRDGQARLRWGRHPVDLFLDTTDFHHAVAGRVRWERLLSAELPFLACRDLAVFKAFFARSKDWVDLEEMLAAGAVDPGPVLGDLVMLLGPDDDRVARLHALAAQGGPSPDGGPVGP